MAIKPVSLEQFHEKAGNIYEAIIVAAKRSRQLHDEIKIELNQRLETIKQLSSTPEAEEDVETTVTNPDQLKISLEFEKRAKVTETALVEVMAHRVKFRLKGDEPVEA